MTISKDDRGRRSNRFVRPFAYGDFAEVAGWWNDGVRFVQRPDSAWLDYVLSADSVDVFCLIESCSDPSKILGPEIVAISQFEREGDVAWLDMVTRPSHLRTGAASELLCWAVEWLRRCGVCRLRASVEQANAPSQGWLQKHGFFREYKEDDLLIFSRSVILQ